MTARQTEPPTTTRALLALGSAAGPFYVIVGIAQILTREGFDWTRHALSLMSNGPWGFAFYLAVLLAWIWLSALFRSTPARAEG